MTTLRTALPVSPLGCRGESRLWVELILGNLPGVQTAHVDAETEMAYVEYDPALTTPVELSAVFQRWGVGPPDEGEAPGPELSASDAWQA